MEIIDKKRFIIRKASQSDLSLIVQLIHELAVYEKLGDEAVADECLLNEWIFEKRSAEVLIAELAGTPVGFALFFQNFSTFVGRAGLYLEDLYVRPEYRGRGFGKALLIHLARLAKERNLGRFEWVCLDWNRPSIDFYLSLGAIPMNDWTIYRLAGEKLDKLAETDC